MELDARSAPDGTILDADVGIVGAGPAGIVLAHALLAQDAGRQVVVIESGGWTRDAAADELNAGETVGDRYQDLRLVRSRGLGGSAALWNTMFQGAAFAKYVPLDGIDFERGWPIDAKELEPYYRRAHEVAGLGPFEYGGLPGGLDLGAGGLINGIYRYGAADRFTVTLPRGLARSASGMLVAGATATELVRGEDRGRVTEVRWAALSGRRGGVRAARFVLAAGAIENARLLLAAGFEHEWVGRGFMEHPVDRSLQLVSRSPALRADPSFYSAHVTSEGIPVVGRIGLAPDLMRSERLRNASVRIFADTELPLDNVRLIGGAIRRVSGAVERFRGHRYGVLLDLEQAPHPENRVVLGEGRDRFGQRRAALHWRWRAEDQANRERVRTLVAGELARAAAGRVEVRAEGALDPVVHHHAGTTRMHGDPAEGVVDADLRVHGMENLFVTGASVFPTAGVANPMLTVIALSLRLAEELAGNRATR